MNENKQMWVDDTKTLGIEDYRLVQERMFERYALMDGCAGYGTFGSVQAPGLSDLDLVVAFHDKVLARRDIRFGDLVAKDRYIMMHGPLVVPVSLLSHIALYHLVVVKWSKEPDGVCGDQLDLRVACMHVIEKTVYLQRFLWRMALLPQVGCRRAFIAFTSLARSVEWFVRLGGQASVEHLSYAADVHQLRRDWIGAPGERATQVVRLRALGHRALAVAIELPETLVCHFMGRARGGYQVGDAIAGLHRPPLQFLLRVSDESLIRIADAAKIGAERIENKVGWAPWGRRIGGGIALVGPATFALFQLEMNVRRFTSKRLGAFCWGGELPNLAAEDVSLCFRLSAESIGMANGSFARILAHAGLEDCNFGNVWTGRGPRGALTRLLCASYGRGAPIRLFQSRLLAGLEGPESTGRGS